MKKLLYAFCFGASAFSLHAQQDFDPSFGGDGWTTDLMVTASQSYTDVVVQPDKKILVAGCSVEGINYRPFVRRFNTNGTRDNGFGSSGEVQTPYNAAVGTDEQTSVAVDATGRIYIATSSANNNGMQVTRLSPTGLVDNTFGNNGMLWDSTGTDVYYEDLMSILIQPDGKILVCGGYRHLNPNETGAFVIRYNTDGARDASFGTNGLAKVVGENFVANRMVIQSDGKIIGGGKKRLTTQQKDDFLVFRLNANGTLDNTYGPDQTGVVIIGLQDIETIRGMALQSDGSLIFGGPCGNGYTHTRIVKLQPNGVGDVNFGTEHTSTGNIGYTKLDFIQFIDQYISSLVVTADDKIIVGGGWNNEIYAIRYTANGIPDSTFSGDARADSTFFQHTIGSRAGALDEASGRFYNVGRINFSEGPEMFVAAFKIGPGSAPSSVEETEKPFISVYPNPASDVLFLTSTSEKYNNVEIYDATGKRIKSEINITDNSIDIQDLRNGIYFLKISVGEETYSTRIIVSK